MTIYLLSAVIAVALLLLGENIKPNDTKVEYLKRGYNWNNVLIVSSVSGLAVGLVSAWLTFQADLPSELNPYLLPFVTAIVGYITAQSMLTDFRTFMINRSILRVAYILSYLAAILNIVTSDLLRPNWLTLSVFTIVLIVLFFIAPIGASDIRMMAVGIPYSISINGMDGIFLLAITLIIVAVGMAIQRLIKGVKEYKKYKANNKEVYENSDKFIFVVSFYKVIKNEFDTKEEHAVAVGPYMLLPFLIYFIIYPVLI